MSARIDVLRDTPIAHKHPTLTSAKELVDNRSRQVSLRHRVLEEPSPREYRHWSPQSQPYAPADVLLHLLDDGWCLQPQAFVESYRCVSGRHVNVYLFVLLRNQERKMLWVVENPAVRRLVQMRRLTVETAEERFVSAKPPNR